MLGRLLGYRPFPVPPTKPELMPLAPPLPPFTAGGFFFPPGPLHKPPPEEQWNPEKHMGAFVGYRTRGGCRPYLGGEPAPDDPPDDLRWLHVFCPWTLDVGAELNRSVFDSDFLALEYRSFLRKIGFVPGMAASIKTSLGPVALVGEWNGALGRGEFLDDSFTSISIRPRAWQGSLGCAVG